MRKIVASVPMLALLVMTAGLLLPHLSAAQDASAAGKTASFRARCKPSTVISSR